MKSSQSLFLLAGIFLTILTSGLSEASIVGETKESIITQFGKPSSTELSSQNVILRYPQGAITFVNNKATSYIGNFDLASETDKAIFSHSSPTINETKKTKTVVTPPFPKFLWNTTIEAAQQKAEQYELPILALFTGPDWCPPCIQLENEVFTDDRFKRFVEQHFIPLKVALYRNSYQQPAQKAQYEELSAHYGNRGVPAFYILDKDGEKLSKPDIFRSYEGANDRTELIIAALEQNKDSSILDFSPIKIVAGLGILLLVLRIVRR